MNSNATAPNGSGAAVNINAKLRNTAQPHNACARKINLRHLARTHQTRLSFRATNARMPEKISKFALIYFYVFLITMKLRTLLLLLLAAPLAAHARPPITAPADEFNALMEKIRLDFRQNPDISASLALFDTTQGRFTDIDYASRQRTEWPPQEHVERLLRWAAAYTCPDGPHCGSEALYRNIIKGLAFWQARNPQCNNWWYNQIAEPQRLGVLLIMMRAGRQQVPAQLEADILARMRSDGGDPARWTGANRTDIALHWIYRACLERDTADLAYALRQVYSPVRYTTQEGFQHDNSYFQHGRQLYIGGYGDEILKGVTQVAQYTRGTRYAMPQEKIDLLSRFMRHTYYATIRGRHMLFDVMGRSMSRPGAPIKTATALYARRMMDLDTAHAAEFAQIIARLEGKQPAAYALRPVHTHYFRGDYTLHVRPAYTFDVRLVSDRTARCEYGNGENLKTYFLSDGCTNITRRGDEYDGIFPVWNWTRIPGTTAPQLDTVPMARSDWQCPGTSDFAGGVSDSLYGATAYDWQDDYRNIRTGGHKGWFFFDNEVVCLGAGIHSAADAPVLTTVNQCLAAAGGARIGRRLRSRAVTAQERTYGNARWALHDGVGYAFPQGGHIMAALRPQRGSWHDINHSVNRHDTVEKQVFTLCLDHGRQPRQATYAYVVVPDARNRRRLRRALRRIEVVSNTPALQAVGHKGLQLLQCLFFEAGTLRHDGLTVRTDGRCALMLRRLPEGRTALHVADPSQSGRPIRVELTLPNGQQHTVVHRPLPDPTYAGATRAYTL